MFQIFLQLGNVGEVLLVHLEIVLNIPVVTDLVRPQSRWRSFGNGRPLPCNSAVSPQVDAHELRQVVALVIWGIFMARLSWHDQDGTDAIINQQVLLDNSDLVLITRHGKRCENRTH